jgi:hypothetical protein
MSKIAFSPCLLLLGLTPLSAFADDQHCSLATLHGTYAFAGAGTYYGDPYTSSGRETYDGQGHIKFFQLWDQDFTTTTYTGTGTYTMTADCVATATYGTLHWTYFVAPDGGTFYYNNNNNTGNMAAGHEDRISRALLF